jgi:hypothetical protein
VDDPDRELDSGRNASIQTDIIHGCKRFTARSAWRIGRSEFVRGAVDDRGNTKIPINEGT